MQTNAGNLRMHCVRITDATLCVHFMEIEMVRQYVAVRSCVNAFVAFSFVYIGIE